MTTQPERRPTFDVRVWREPPPAPRPSPEVRRRERAQKGAPGRANLEALVASAAAHTEATGAVPAWALHLVAVEEALTQAVQNRPELAGVTHRVGALRCRCRGDACRCADVNRGRP